MARTFYGHVFYYYYFSEVNVVSTKAGIKPEKKKGKTQNPKTYSAKSSLGLQKLLKVGR